MCAFKVPDHDALANAVSAPAVAEGASCPYLRGALSPAACPHVGACTDAVGQACAHAGACGKAAAGRTTSTPALAGLENLFLVGLNHHTAEVDLREKFYEEQVELMVTELRALGLDEAAVLFTCNRIEVYGVRGAAGAEAVVAQFSRRCGMGESELAGHLYVNHGHDAALHLLRVAAGLESLVLGESQILGQVGQAAARAQAAGTLGTTLNRLFNSAVEAGKRARTETEIGRHTLSVSHAGVMLAKAARTDFATANVLVIGAGEMAKLAISALQSHGATRVSVANRTPNRAQLIATDCSSADCAVDAVCWSGLRTALANADIVIAATASPTPIVRTADMQLGGRKLRTFIDLGMPRNIEKAVGSLPNVELHDVDDLQQVVEQHRIQRQREALRVEAILAEEMQKCLDRLRGAELAPVIAGLRKKVEATIAAELERTLKRLPATDPAVREELEMLAHRIAAKMLHAPTLALRSPSGTRLADTVRTLYDLRDETPSQG